MRETRNIYLAVLRKDLPSPLAKESDEEKESKGTDATRKTKTRTTRSRRSTKPDTSAQQPDRHLHRTAAVRQTTPPARRPIRRRSVSTSRASSSGSWTCRSRPANLSNLQAGSAGQIYFLREVGRQDRRCSGSTSRSARPRRCVPDVADYRVSADGKKLLYKAKDSWFIVPTTKEIKPGDGKIAADAIEVKVDPRAEWNEVFDEAWRINRDYFYDPSMHGVDWKAARAEVRGASSRT